MKKTPIVIFAYNRPIHLQKTLLALGDCHRLEECHVYIFCDGLKNQKESELVDQVRQVAMDWAESHDASLIIRKNNIGLKNSVISGVNQVFKNYSRVIVIEDDIIVSPIFVSFMLEALDRYEKESIIYQIAGFLFSADRLADKDAFLIPLTSSWGWATWKRAWEGCDFEIKQAPLSLKNKTFRRKFDLDGIYPWTKMLEDEYFNNIDTWDIQFYYHVFMNNGLVVYPCKTLVYNAGFDSSGIHCGNHDVNPINIIDLQKFEKRSNFAFPEVIAVDPKVLHKHKISIKKMYPTNEIRLFISKIKSKLFQLTKN